MGSAGEVQALVTDPKLVEERRGQIVRAAVKLFSEDGYYTTTIQQIARQAGISTGLIYQYFRDKDDIREALGRSPDKGDSVAQTFAVGIPPPGEARNEYEEPPEPDWRL